MSRDSFLVQAMVEGGVELLIGVVDDPVFGPVLACGSGGIEAELLKDVAVRVCPLTPEDADEMLRSLALFPRLTGYRGADPVDLTAVEEMLLRVGAMVEAHREIAELDLNPVVARRRRRARGRRADPGSAGAAIPTLAEHLEAGRSLGARMLAARGRTPDTGPVLPVPSPSTRQKTGSPAGSNSSVGFDFATLLWIDPEVRGPQPEDR